MTLSVSFYKETKTHTHTQNTSHRRNVSNCLSSNKSLS